MLHVSAWSLYHVMQPTDRKRLTLQWCICFEWIWSNALIHKLLNFLFLTFSLLFFSIIYIIQLPNCYNIKFSSLLFVLNYDHHLQFLSDKVIINGLYMLHFSLLLHAASLHPGWTQTHAACSLCNKALTLYRCV